MVINLYPPEIHSPGQELAPSPPWRVASGSLSLISRRFFINQNPFEVLILVSLPNNVANIVHIKANLQIKFLFFSRKHKAENLKLYILISCFLLLALYFQ